MEANILFENFIKNTKNKKLMKLIGSKTDQLEYKITQMSYFKSFKDLLTPENLQLYNQFRFLQ